MFIYVIRAYGIGVKIGVSKDPVDRLRHLQGANGTKLTMIKAIHCKHARLAEAIAHKMLNQHRLSGEWFRVRPERALTTVQRAIEISKPKLARSKSMAMSGEQRAKLDAFAARKRLGYVDAIMLAISDCP